MNRESRLIIKLNKAFLIYAFVIALPFSWASFAIGSIYRAVTLLLFILFLFESRLIINYSSEKRFLLFGWLLYLGYAVITMLWAVNRDAAITNSLSLVLLGFIVIIFFSTDLQEEESYKTDLCWIVSGIICIFLYIFGDKTAVGEYGSRTSMIIMGTATDPNEFASVFIVPLSLMTFNLLNKKGPRILQIIIMLLSLYCVLMSGSRGALIAVAVAMIITLLQSGKVDVKSVLIIIAFAIIVLLLSTRYIIPLIPDDVLTRMSLKALLTDGGSGRGDLWTDAVRKIWNGSVLRMMFGYGQYGLTVGTKGVSQTMHNQLIQQLSNYGIVGLVLYLILIYKSYKSIKLNCPRYMGAFIGMMVMSLTITMSVAYKLIWILLLMPAVMSNKGKEIGFDDGK